MAERATERTTDCPGCAGARHLQEPPKRGEQRRPQPGAAVADASGAGWRPATRRGRRVALFCGVVALLVGGGLPTGSVMLGTAADDNPVVQSTISAGGDHTCGVRTDGTLACLGGQR